MIGRRGFLVTAVGGLLTQAAHAESAEAAPGRDEERNGGAVYLPPQAGTMTAAFQDAVNRASLRNGILSLGTGTYSVAGVKLPATCRIVGTAGATRIASAGPGPSLWAEGGQSIQLRDIVFDGMMQGLTTGQGIVSIGSVADVQIDGCTFHRSPMHGLVLRGSGGRVIRSRIENAMQVGLFATDSRGLVIEANTVSGCGNGGILVWRSAPGADGTIVRGNRIQAIRADAGGTGQNGNGVNVFRADNVIVTGNLISGCAFSAIRGNSASDFQVAGNQCLRSGETAIYAEFAFQGAVITGNLVDGAAVGISVVNLDQGGRLAVVRGNLVRNLKTTAPYQADSPIFFGNGIAVEADAAISDNVVENAPNIGLMLGFGPYMRDITVNANVIRLTNYAIAPSVADGAGPAIIVNNMIRTARKGGIVGFRHTTPATADLIGGAGSYTNLTISGNRSYA